MERNAGRHPRADTASTEYPGPAAAIAIVDKRPLIRELVASYLRGKLPFQIVEADSSERFIDGTEAKITAFVVVFQAPPFAEVGKPLASIARIREAFPDAPIIVVSDFGSYDLVAEAFRCGARGFIPTGTSLAIFEQALRTVLAGGEYVPVSVLKNSSAAPDRSGSGAGPRFTPRQQEVLELLREGLPNKMIAFRLDMRESTVKVHLRQIMRKMNATNRTQVVASLTNAPDDEANPGAGLDDGARLLQTTTS